MAVNENVIEQMGDIGRQVWQREWLPPMTGTSL